MAGKSERDGVHREGKKAHPWWATDEEWQALKDAAQEAGCPNVTALLRAIANGEATVTFKGE